MLIHSAAGGVGIAATRIAKPIGAKVVATASAAKHGALPALGMDELIDYRPEDFEKRARDVTDGRGDERILDAVGSASPNKGQRLLAPTGRLGIISLSCAATNQTGGYLVMIAALARTPWLQFTPLSLMNANKGVFGVNLGHNWGEVARLRRWMDAITVLWTEGAIKPQIARALPFDEASAAHHFIQNRKSLGKVLLTLDHLGANSAGCRRSHLERDRM